MAILDYQTARKRMVDQQITIRGITSPAVLCAFLEVPRHLFVPKSQQAYSYQDSPLPIGLGQTISQPYIAAYMTDLLQLTGVDRVLEIGTGSGYQAAILGILADQVHTIERHPSLADNADRLLQSLGYKNVHVHEGDGTQGLPEYGPYKAIMVTAAAPDVPSPLLDQLGEGGRLVMPVGGRGGQVLLLYVREGDEFHRQDLTPVAFVPLIGEYGWAEEY